MCPLWVYLRPHVLTTNVKKVLLSFVAKTKCQCLLASENHNGGDAVIFLVIHHRVAGCKGRSASLANTAASPLLLTKCKFKGGVSWVTKPVAIYSKLCIVQKWAPTMASLKKQNKRSTTAEKYISLHQSVDSWRHLKLWQCLVQPRWFFAAWSWSQWVSCSSI